MSFFAFLAGMWVAGKLSGDEGDQGSDRVPMVDGCGGTASWTAAQIKKEKEERK